MPGTALIVAGGARPDPLVVDALPPVDFGVAADSGADSALALGLPVQVIVGDLDSVSVEGLAAAREAGLEIQQHPAHKNFTDLELALDQAAQWRPDRVVVIGIGGGRLDHALANMSVLAADRFDDARVEGLVGTARLTVIRGSRTLDGLPGELVSLLPILGPVAEVTTVGLEYPLAAEPLEPGAARGVSNRFVDRQATVTASGGVLLAVQPFALGSEPAS